MIDNVPKVETIRGLLENSGNQCAFPGCHHPVLNHRNLLIAKLSFLDPSMESVDDRNSPENLMFLCYRHAVETRDSITYPLEILRSIKENHEHSTLVEQSSRFKMPTITSIQDSMAEQETEEELTDYLNKAVAETNEVKPPLEPTTDDYKVEDSIEILPVEETEQQLEEEHITQQISALTEEMNLPDNPPFSEESDVIQVSVGNRAAQGRELGSPKKIGRITFRNSDSKRLHLQLNQLKSQINELFGMLDHLRQSDNDLNKDLKSMVSSLDILGIFHHRFSKLSFRKNPFINRNYNQIHARVPKLRNTLESLVNAMESIAGGNQPAGVQNIKEDELPLIDRPTTRILIKSIRYADQIAN